MPFLSLSELDELAAIGGYSNSTNLSNFSAALLLSAAEWYGNINNWIGEGYELTDAEIDTIEANVATVLSEIMTNMMLGSIVWSIVKPDKVPAGWLLCDGSEYLASLYPELFAIVDAPFKNLADPQKIITPDLKSRVIAGVDTGKSNGSTAGADSKTLTISNMPSHSHGYSRPLATPIPVQAGGAGGTFTQVLAGTTTSQGSGSAFDNRPSTIYLYPYMIAT